MAINYPDTIDVEKIDRKGQAWLQYHDEWEVLSVLYEGGLKLKQQGQNLLLKRPKELYDVYQERYRRLTYQDILANCTRWYLAKLFQTEPKIDGKTGDDRWDRFLQNCDQSGSTFIKFARDVAEKMFLYRAAFVLIDKPEPEDRSAILTRADEQSQGLDQPYLVCYDPRQAINWSVDRFGNLTWVVFKVMLETQESPISTVKQSIDWYVFDQQNFAHYRYDVPEEKRSSTLAGVGKMEWAGIDAKAQLLDSGPHVLSKFGRVPVRVCQFPDSLWFANATYLQLVEHLDYLNSYAWKLFITCHPQLVIYTDDDLSGKTLSEVNYLKLGKEDRAEYLEPDGSTFSECRNYLELLREEIYRSWHLQAQAKTSSATAESASGYSKELDMAPAVDVLNAIGDQLRSDQQLILTDFKAAAGMPFQESDAPDVNGYRFETKPALQQIDVAQAVIDLGLNKKSPTLEKTLDKEVAIPLLDGQNEETKKQILDEIDNAPTRQEAEDLAAQQQQQAFATQLQRATGKTVLTEEQQSAA